MRRRLDVGEVELGDLGDRLEDRAQLLREALDLLLAQLEPREPRDVQYLVPSCELAAAGSWTAPKTKRGPCGPRLTFEACRA